MNERTRRTRRTKAAAIATVALVSGWIALAACSNMDEGERCQTANLSDDCASGLVCIPANQLNPGFNSADRCCPPDRSKATHPACTLLQNPIAGDSAPPADSGPVGTDAGGDTGAEAAADATADADAEVDAADAADQ